VDPLEDQPAIAVQVSDNRVDLGKSEAHGPPV
jgi:hypothetical protein